jgi:hypothetical protein
MTTANALNALNNVGGKNIATLEDFQTFTKAQAIASVSLTSTAGNVATDASLSNTFTLTLTENVTLTNPTNLVSGTRYTWVITQGASAFTVALDSAFLATLDTFVMPGGAGDKEVLEAIYDGTNLIYTFDVQASSDFVLQNDVFVSKNGVNAPGGGNISSPFGDPFYATDQTTGSLSNQHIINISPGIYGTASFLVKPCVGYDGNREAVVDVSAAVELGPAWSTAVSGSTTTFSNITIDGSVSLDFAAINALPAIGVEFFNVDIVNSVTGIFSDAAQFFEADTTNFGAGLTLTCVRAFLRNCNMSNDVSIEQKGSGAGANVINADNCTFRTDVSITADVARPSLVYIRNSAIYGGITVDTPYASLELDISSYPAGGITYTNGATSAQVLIVGGASPGDTVYVQNNGNDSNATGEWFRPYATIAAAITATTGAVADPKTILIYPGPYSVASSLSIKPNQSLLGFSMQAPIDYSSYTLDSSWSGAAVGSSAFIQNLFFQNNWSLDFSTFGSSKSIFFRSCILGDITVIGTTSNVPSVRLNDCRLTALTLQTTSADIINCHFIGDISVSQSAGGGAATNFFHSCYFTSATDITISGASGSTQTVNIFCSPIRGTLTVDTTFVTLNIDADSIPSGGITYTNGATSAQVNILGGAPAKTFNNAYTGQNYITPVAQNSSANATAWNLNTAPNAKQTMTENTTLSSPTGQIEGSMYTFKFVQDSTPRTLAFNSVYKFPGAVTPVVSTGSGAVDIFTFYSDGTNMRCIGIAQNIS